ncbi:Protein kinase superfamily protein [Zea mays]|uniref:Protein kinase superfamily protein n=1 Tax=Zea mays TaxID=4577 RepID=A0A1D6G0E3_MAIZE|nr:Protein kinase superfamily protein [Zea mays]
MRQPTSAGGDAGFVRADQIDLKSLDEQLERHLGRRAERGVGLPSGTGSRGGESARLGPEELTPLRRCREDWEIDPTKLVIKGVIARGTFGTVHRGVYDGQDVAGIAPAFTLLTFYTANAYACKCHDEPIFIVHELFDEIATLVISIFSFNALEIWFHV